MAYLGLVPSESSTGKSVIRGSITRTGNARVSRVLAESAWAYRYPARLGKRKYVQIGRTPGDRLECPIATDKQVQNADGERKAQHGRRDGHRLRSGRLHVGDGKHAYGGGLTQARTNDRSRILAGTQAVARGIPVRALR